MKFTKYAVSVFLCITLLSGLILFFVTDKKDFSENENRVLEKAPKFSYEALESGKFTLNLEDYIKDHFPLRDALMKLKTKAQIFAGYKKINGVFITKDRLISKLEMPETEDFTDSINKLFSNIEGEIETSVMIVPTASVVYEEALPSHSVTVDEKELIDSILSSINCDNRFDLLTLFVNKKDNQNNLFYKTDHHWTSYAASLAYEEFLSKTRRYKTDIKYSIEQVSDNFRGTLYSKVLDDSLNDTMERINIAGVEFTCKSGNTPDELEESEYYADSYLSKKDKYAYFGNENQPLIILENAKCESEDEIVIVKDSFANCFAPLLTANYKRVHIIDTRYLKKPKVSEYVNSIPNVTDVLVLYGIDSLNNNTGITRIS